MVSPTRELALQIGREAAGDSLMLLVLMDRAHEAETLLSLHDISLMTMIGGTSTRHDQAGPASHASRWTARFGTAERCP